MSRSLSPLVALFLAPALLSAGEPAGERRRDQPRARAEWNALLRQDADGAVLAENRLRALRAACDVRVDPTMARPPAGAFSRSDAGPSLPAGASLAGATWLPLGPLPAQSMSGGGIDFGYTSGRITALAVHPRDASFVLVGAATGGIWKSTDGGSTFRPVSDTSPALAISGLTFSPGDPDVIYAATGEADSADLEFLPTRSYGTYLGAGLLRSVDAGESWTRVDVDLPANAVLSRVLVHPTDPQKVLVAVYLYPDVAGRTVRVGGTYRSTDGGVHFTRTFAHGGSDLAQDPNQPDVVYAAFGITGGCASCSDPSGVYRSADFGATWTPSLTAASPQAGFETQTGNVKIGVTRTDPVTIYASVLDSLYSSHSGGGIYRSTDGGATWQKRTVHPQMCGDQCEYDHVVLPHPTEKDVVYFGAVDLYKSTDGGATWRMLTNVYYAGGTVHVDHHAMAIPQTAPGTIYFGNDGGLNRSTDGGTTFQNLNATLGLIQFNGLTLHPVDPELAMGGTQDNGGLRYKGTPVWTDRIWSDGGAAVIHATEPTRILMANYYAYLNYSSSTGDTFVDATPWGLLMTRSGDPKEPMLFYPPMATAPAAPGTVFFSTQRVWANPTLGSNPSAWSPRSAASITKGRISALDVLGDGSGPLWIGSTIGEVMLSTDGGATFTARNAGLPSAVVTAIRSFSADGLSAYVAFGGFLGSPSRHLFRTLDGGQTWTNLTEGLPDAPATALALVPGDPSGLFLATDVGVFRSSDGGASWTSFNQGLPNTTVMALEIHAVTRDLWAATYGRGAFRMPYSSWSSVPPVADFSFAPDDPAPQVSVAFTDRTTGEATAWSWDFDDGTPLVGERSPRHAFAKAGTHDVKLTASGPGGSATRTAQVKVRAGVASPVTLQVPVVLDVFGVAPAHYTSDLVVTNAGSAATRFSLLYLPAPGTPGQPPLRLGASLGAGRDLRLADVLSYLRTSGAPLPPSGPLMAGTLLLTFEDSADRSLLFAGSRTSTPNPNGTVGGSFGLFTQAVASDEAPLDATRVIGLQENGSFRSNLAVVDVPPDAATAGSPAALSIQLVDGTTGSPSGDPIAVELGAGQWFQLDRVLTRAGLSSGWARITRTAGTNRFLAYGVVNDGGSAGSGTSDGSFLPAGAGEGLVPIVLDVTGGGVRYRTDLVLTNPQAVPVTATLAFTPSAQLGGGSAGMARVEIGAGRQLLVTDAVGWLRDTLGMPLPPSGSNVGGTLLVTGASALARTWNPNPDLSVGGTFGLAYAAVATPARARTEAWVHGLVQDGSSRSNLAVADGRAGDPQVVAYAIEVFDTLSGASAPAWTGTVSLAGGGWAQVDGILSKAGLSRGSARVRAAAASDFVVYGVLNDGGAPGERTSDGSYVAMSGVR